MITLRGVTKHFGDQLVLDGLDLDLTDGAATAVMGANGSGKTTLGRLLLGLATPDAGTISVPAGLRRAAVFQEDRLCEQLTAVGNVRLVLDRSVRARAVIDELRRVGLDDDSLAKPVRDLSGGQRRRVVLVRGLMAEADLVVLDEPFTGLDVDAKVLALEYARERCAGRTTLLITHDVADATFLGARVVRLGPAPRSGGDGSEWAPPAEAAPSSPHAPPLTTGSTT
jgi:NitT/TauT family transport system ATP-binding protein